MSGKIDCHTFIIGLLNPFKLEIYELGYTHAHAHAHAHMHTHTHPHTCTKKQAINSKACDHMNAYTGFSKKKTRENMLSSLMLPSLV